tara:strand:+ start:12239 stop:13006 length:768 start_codon:yes stop_codon:yes gene_type:complete
MKIDFLKLFYKTMLLGLPQYIYNPISNNNFLAPLTVKPYSTYVNFKLEEHQVDYINNYIKKYSDELTLVPLKISKYEFPSYYINVNIYNCTSPILMSDDNIIRCEINTYVKNADGTLGTLILDYLSDGLSLDPINMFKRSNKMTFLKDNGYNIIHCESNKQEITLDLSYSILNSEKFKMSKELVDYTDNIYYKNGIMDKIYYDSSLTRANIKETNFISNFVFKYKDLEFENIDSIFYFEDELRFVGSVWNNIYDK